MQTRRANRSPTSSASPSLLLSFARRFSLSSGLGGCLRLLGHALGPLLQHHLHAGEVGRAARLGLQLLVPGLHQLGQLLVQLGVELAEQRGVYR